MLYLASPVRPEVYPLAAEGRIGILFQPAYRPRPYHNLAEVTWAADNGCYAAGDKFDLDRYLDFLDRYAEHAGTCLFATAPDVLEDPVATWERGAPVLPQIRGRGYPAAFVAQDGFDATEVDWDSFDVLFVGGSTRWKLTRGYELAALAHSYGKRAHLGRVNSGKRYRAGMWAGFDSADGTFLAYSPDRNRDRLVGWLDSAHAQPQLIAVLPDRWGR
jgi:hypothetical protein